MTLTPPLQLAWRKDTQFVTAVAGNDSLYGITPTGKIQALRASDGALRWESKETYVTTRLALNGNRLFAYCNGKGLSYVDDTPTSPNERLAVSFGASKSEAMSSPIIDGRMVYTAVNEGFYGAHQDQGLQVGAILGEVIPHTIGLVATKDIILINGKGVPSRYRVGNNNLDLIWAGSHHGVEVGQQERPFVIVDNRVVIGVGDSVVAYDLTTGRFVWRLPNLAAGAFTTANNTVYAAFRGAQICAIRPDDGTLLWQRQYIYDSSLQREYGLAIMGDYLFFGGALQSNPDAAMLLGLSSSDGSFSWVSRSVAGPWASGIPLTDGAKMFAFGTSHVGAYVPLQHTPTITTDDLEVMPRPLRGPSSQFGNGTFKINLPVSAKISVAAYREREGLGTIIVNGVTWSAGQHEVSWNPNTLSGFRDTNQFGYILVTVEESGGDPYTQALILPVNSFPDILQHWARHHIEVMTFHKYVNGYPDQTFRPNGLVSRAESSTIVAKTLNLESPSSSFSGTRFTDISTHWAQNFIMALEERGIVSGFRENDGTYTFRPNLNMSRAQEAAILVRAYDIPSAPTGFETKFIDITNHWAAENIKALESAGYVNGFEEENGSYSYRPEQHLTRSELSTIVVRIRHLSR